MQTIPAFSYLVPVVLLFGIGVPTALIATVIFAIPPAIRLTGLGVRQVPETSIEVGRSFGSTSRQLLRRVQLPLAKPAILLGVNQTIMMALGIVVIAASVGVGGLGQVVFDGLNNLNVGSALAGGLAIVALAIVLDRTTSAWGARDRKRRGTTTVHVYGREISRLAATVVALALVAVAIFIGRQILRQQDFPSSWTVNIEAPVNDALSWITRTFGGVTTAITNVTVKYALDPLKNLLTDVPWWMVAGFAALIGWRVSRRWTLAALAFVGIAAVGVLGLWSESMDTLSQVMVAVVVAVALAIPIGIWCAQSDRVERALRPILDMMQTMPQFVYLVPVVALFGPGRVPGVIAGLVYALPPGIRLTNLGIRQVPREIVEAAEAYGANRSQTLWKVQVPLARPSILLGVNQTIIMVFSVVIIAGLIGGAGLGLEVVRGLSHDPGARHGRWHLHHAPGGRDRPDHPGHGRGQPRRRPTQPHVRMEVRPIREGRGCRSYRCLRDDIPRRRGVDMKKRRWGFLAGLAVLADPRGRVQRCEQRQLRGLVGCHRRLGREPGSRQLRHDHQPRHQPVDGLRCERRRGSGAPAGQAGLHGQDDQDR